ncbi:MAG: hypothetical protein KatS3mg084_0628 [Candidatus Dojkabacteria bacterium]|nr:MAG: hypothetical protein KatS3mg084_0628 [Candidatus Dojkabacteria bacterium]
MQDFAHLAMLYTTVILLLILGVLITFFGLRLVRVFSVLLGFIIGFTLGTSLTGTDWIFLTNSDKDLVQIAIAITVPLALGVVAMLVAILFLRFGVALVGANLVFTLLTNLAVIMGFSSDGVNFLIVLISILVFIGVFVSHFYNTVVILITSVYGALYIVIAIFLILVQDMNILNVLVANHYIDILKNNNEINRWYLVVWLGTWGVFSLLGARYQLLSSRYKSHNSHNSHNKNSSNPLR